MRLRSCLLVLLSAVCVQAQQLTSFGGATFPGSSGAGFVTNGGSFPSSSILTSGGNLSVIGTANGATGQDYEVKTTYRLQTSGGSLVTYLRATPDAQLAGGGTFYAVHLSNIDINGASCSASVTLWRVVNGVHENKATAFFGCRDGMTLRTIVRSNWIYILLEGAPSGLIFWADSAPLTTGRPGLGSIGTPAANGITSAGFYDTDQTPPPLIASPGVTSLSNRIELQWPAAVDNGGSGFYLYVVDRRKNGGTVNRYYTRFPNFADVDDVSASATFEYWIYGVDQHQNWSAGRAFVVRTPPAGETDPRRIGCGLKVLISEAAANR